MAAGVVGAWGWDRSTWAYSTRTMDADTALRLTELRDRLAAAGAPERALRSLSAAARPGIYLGNALEALIEADRYLQPALGNPVVAEASPELRAIHAELYRKDHWWGPADTPEVLSPRDQ